MGWFCCFFFWVAEPKTSRPPWSSWGLLSLQLPALGTVNAPWFPSAPVMSVPIISKFLPLLAELSNEVFAKRSGICLWGIPRISSDLNAELVNAFVSFINPANLFLVGLSHLS